MGRKRRQGCNIDIEDDDEIYNAVPVDFEDDEGYGCINANAVRGDSNLLNETDDDESDLEDKRKLASRNLSTQSEDESSSSSSSSDEERNKNDVSYYGPTNKRMRLHNEVYTTTETYDQFFSELLVNNPYPVTSRDPKILFYFPPTKRLIKYSDFAVDPDNEFEQLEIKNDFTYR